MRPAEHSEHSAHSASGPLRRSGAHIRGHPGDIPGAVATVPRSVLFHVNRFSVYLPRLSVELINSAHLLLRALSPGVGARRTHLFLRFASDPRAADGPHSDAHCTGEVARRQSPVIEEISICCPRGPHAVLKMPYKPLG